MTLLMEDQIRHDAVDGGSNKAIDTFELDITLLVEDQIQL